MPARSRSAAEALRPLVTSEAFGQLVRFGIAGVGVTLLSTLVYLALAVPAHLGALVANGISWCVGVGVGYTIHSRWSFRAEAGAAAIDSAPAMFLRFVAAAAFGLGLNSLWVWLGVHAFHLPPWAPVPAMVFVTPLASFAINRWWVFR